VTNITFVNYFYLVYDERHEWLVTRDGALNLIPELRGKARNERLDINDTGRIWLLLSSMSDGNVSHDQKPMLMNTGTADSALCKLSITSIKIHLE
jgi:hypothetical protein